MRLIDADKARAEFEKHKATGNFFVNVFLKGAIDIIDCTPTVDPVNHARWIKSQYDKDSATMRSYYCSYCGKYEYASSRTRLLQKAFCPYCGAKMDAGEATNEAD